MTSPADVHAAKLATIEAAADAEESLRERVARAIFHAEDAADDWDYYADGFKDEYRRYADAAIATICTPVEGAPAGCGAEAALRRVLALADDYDRAATDAEQEGLAYAPTSEVREYHRRVATAGHAAAHRIRDAAGGAG